MIDYEGAKKIVEDAGFIDDNEGHLDVHYRKIADLLTELKRLRNIILKFDDAIYNGNFDINQLLGIWHNLLTKEEEE